MKSGEILVKCDECEHEFFLKTVGINEAIVELNGVSVTLVYFACPKCNKIYRVSIQDRRYYELKEDLEKTKKRMQRNNGSNNMEVSKIFYSMIVKKHERLKAHVDKINRAFPGTFIFVTSEDDHNQKSIKYLP